MYDQSTYLSGFLLLSYLVSQEVTSFNILYQNTIKISEEPVWQQFKGMFPYFLNAFSV